jgi:hypothetical protein
MLIQFQKNVNSICQSHVGLFLFFRSTHGTILHTTVFKFNSILCGKVLGLKCFEKLFQLNSPLTNSSRTCISVLVDVHHQHNKGIWKVVVGMSASRSDPARVACSPTLIILKVHYLVLCDVVEVEQSGSAKEEAQ